ncbi:PAS domain-containing sensor histidine kinase [Solitalea lacus]|uniref:PAS domain-containing sensor histidine kinase n=1 Tax=Solitalea lacus TaxID=2911172 RepID=UPI001EDBE4BC|nr:PAS domain-containing sensor histidine kinase [Solitalea lacus]UKJ06722.1 PAS domain-containing sensor histidine kinase [Solitalea lacus]
MKNKPAVLAGSNTTSQFEALFDHASIGIIFTDQKGKIVNFNHQAELQFGYHKHEVLGKLIELLIPQQFHSKHLEYRKDFYDHPQNRPMGTGRDLYAKKKDGSEFPVEVSLCLYRTIEEMQIIAFVTDITVRKRKEELLLQQQEELHRFSTKVRQLNRELEQKVEDRTKMLRETLAELEKSKDKLNEALEKEIELSDLKSRFVTLASHEFRTPLSTILSSAALIGRYNTQEDQGKRSKHIQRIKSSVASLKSILEDFLSLGKLEEGCLQAKMEITQTEICCTEIEDVIQDMQQIVKPGQIINFTHGGKSEAIIDIALLKNIVVNLISNAIKFSPENSIIHVVCNVTDNDLVLIVKDNGIGISEEDQQHLFERFFRAKNATNIQGTGLGLNIVAKYLELMSGSIEIQSKLNEGSTFTVYVPQINHNS